MTNYEYFSGANVKINFNLISTQNEEISKKEVIECAGISYSYQNSRQPAYGYNSTRYDAVLPGREIIQGNFLINYVEPNYVFNLINPEAKPLETISGNTLLTPAFDIQIVFGDDLKKSRILKNCFIVSLGQTIQISEQVLIEEYSFIARNIDYNS